MRRQTLVAKYFSPSKKEKEPQRDKTPLHSMRQQINHITRKRERENEFSQEGRKF
jgi:hypothetical protein